MPFELGAFAFGQQAVGEFGAQFRDVVDRGHFVFLSSCEDESAHGLVSSRVKDRGVTGGAGEWGSRNA
ncbi:hypothetical protein MKK64_20730 [Methylobacterium sp. E-025]|uniref:hypothetical protein n=1 Tax=Methylobacterium sp. E-025 TaxID=2836561 RepID=UPI001FBA1799|nr:hypothetical protein [Methylobacterium sp. E-025]MCJ2113596.1 hypothetical protein [Methylobacterium sp. E-025]